MTVARGRALLYQGRFSIAIPFCVRYLLATSVRQLSSLLRMGRLMSPDWSGGTVPVPYANLSDPQSLNLYGYVGNNPLSMTDPDGHCWGAIQSLCTFSQDVGNGIANATYRPLVTAVEHPIITGKALGNAAVHPIVTVRALRTGVVTTSQQVMTGNGTAIGAALARGSVFHECWQCAECGRVAYIPHDDYLSFSGVTLVSVAASKPSPEPLTSDWFTRKYNQARLAGLAHCASRVRNEGGCHC